MISHPDPREELHHRIVVTLKTRAANSILIWPIAIGVSWAHSYHLSAALLYAATAILSLLFLWVCLPNVGMIVTLSTKFYGGMNRPLKRAVPIAYLGLFLVGYAIAASWMSWSLPAVATGLAWLCAILCGLHGQE